jgi:CRP/FNR family transcriptional regulator, cyclic AMP receptor protein
MSQLRTVRSVDVRDKTLAGVIALRDLPGDVRGRLESQCSWHRFDPQVEIVSYQDTSRDVFFLVRGRVRAVIYSASGTVVAFRDLAAGHMFGEFSAIDGEARSASIEAIEPCVIAQMTCDAFWSLIAAESAFTRAVLVHLTKMNRALSTRVYEFSTLTVQNRIHAELLRLAREQQLANGPAVEIKKLPTHAQIASSISTHREAVSRELTRLTKLGVIKRHTGGLVIPDIKRLALMVEQATGE